MKYILIVLAVTGGGHQSQITTVGEYNTLRLCQETKLALDRDYGRRTFITANNLKVVTACIEDLK